MSQTSVTDLLDKQDELSSFTQEFRLWPTAWNTIQDIEDLGWETIKFGEDEIDNLPDSPGIYSFVINPIITNHPNRYLCYIGKTKRHLKKRLSEYFHESKSPAGRPKIIRVLNKWSGHIEISYLEIEEDQVDELEERLNDAFLPPFQEKFSAEVNKIVNAF